MIPISSATYALMTSIATGQTSVIDDTNAKDQEGVRSLE
jgi:hypothetical protein